MKKKVQNFFISINRSGSHFIMFPTLFDNPHVLLCSGFDALGSKTDFVRTLRWEFAVKIIYRIHKS